MILSLKTKRDESKSLRRGSWGRSPKGFGGAITGQEGARDASGKAGGG